MSDEQALVEVFLSYAQEDEIWRTTLLKHLSSLKSEGRITLWDAGQIVAGTDRATTVEKYLKRASVILLLMSAALLDSHDHEIRQALQRQESDEALVIPILLHPVDWRSTPLARLQPLPSNGMPITVWPNEQAAFSEVVAGIRTALQEVARLVVPTFPTSTFPAGGEETSEPRGDKEEALFEGKKAALIVGINNTRRSSLLPDLKYAEDDADEIASLLRTSACNFVFLQTALTGEKADTQAVRRAVIKLAQQRATQDFLLFYFLGHALPVRTREGLDDIYLVTSDFDETEVIEDANAYLSLRWLREKLSRPDGVAKVLIILDCCYAQKMIHARTGYSDVDASQLIKECIGHPSVMEQNSHWNVILTTGTYTTPAQEREVTGQILAVLRGDVQCVLDNQGNVYVHTLYTYLQEEMPLAQLPSLPEDFPQSWIIATYRERSRDYLEQLQQTQENARWNTVSKIMDEVAEIKNVITDPNYFKNLAMLNRSFHVQWYDRMRDETASLLDLNQENISKFFTIPRVQMQDDFSPESSDVDRLEQFGLLRGSHPTYSALLCFGLNPTRWLAGAFTRCTLWSTNDRHNGWLEAQDYRRDLITQFEFSRDFLRKHLRLTRVISRDERIEELEIPLVALGEALANALVHREYVNQTSPVYIDIFYDRIEICSPGGPPEPMTMESLEEEHRSHPRNPQVARIFYLHQYIEEVGSGIQRMQRTLRDAGLEPARFELGKDKIFKVIFYRPKQSSEEVNGPRNTLQISSTLPKVHDNLPPQRGEFLGREKEKEHLLNSLRSRWPFISIEGLGGMGKTTLAIETARSCLAGPQAALESPFEYVVWVSAKDQPEQKLWLNEVLDTTARILGYPSLMKLSAEQIEQKKAAVSQLLHTYRTLLIIDNFETIEDRALESWIQDIPDPSKVLITSRTSQLRFIRPITLKGLESPAALELIRSFAGSLGLESLEITSEDRLLPLVRVTGGNPNAIRMALGYIKRGRLSLNEVIEHLYIASKTVNNVFDDLFARVWDVMTQNAQDVLLVVPFFVDYASKEALSATTGLTAYYLDNAIEELVELKLLDIKEAVLTFSQHYGVHPLTRAFASAQLRARPEFEKQARMRWSKYYLDFVDRGLFRHEFKEPYWNALPPYNRELVDPEWPNLQEVLVWADQQGQDQILVELTLVLTHYMSGRELFPKRLYYTQKAAEAASRLGRERDAALLHIDGSGWLLLDEGRLADGIAEITTGLRIAETLDASSTEATDLIVLANTWLAMACLEQGDLAEASVLIDKVVSLECTSVIQYRVSFIAGDIAYRKKNIAEAIKIYKNADQISMQYGGEGQGILDRLGNIYLASGEFIQAEACFKEVFDRGQRFGVDERSYAKFGFARVALAKGEKDKARQLAQEVLSDLARTVTFRRLLNEIQNFLKDFEDIS